MDDNHCKNVMNSLWQQKQRQRFCDVILRADDGQVWAHKSIVSANSTAFDTKLFCNNGITNDAGNKPQEISLPGCSMAAVQNVVEFMYTGKVQLTTDNLLQCMSFAQQYFMSQLKQECVQFAKHNTTSANWVSLMKFAMSSNSVELNSILSDYVIGMADEILHSEEFLMLPVDFITYILSSRDKEKLTGTREMQLFKLVVSWISYSVIERKPYVGDLLHSLCIIRLHYDIVKQFLDDSTQLPDEFRTHTELVDWLKVLKTNASVSEYGTDDDTKLAYEVETDESDTAQLTGDDVEYFPTAKAMRKRTKGTSAKKRLNKRKSSIPVRYEDSEVGTTNPPLKLKTGTGRPRGRPRKHPVTKLRTKVLMQPKLTPLAVSWEQNEKKVDVPRGKNKEESVRKLSRKSKKARKPRTTRPVNPNKEKIQCPRCPRTFTVALTFRVHLRGHAITEPWACNKCIFETKHYGMFLSHMRRKHREGDARVQCPKCPKMFSSESACNYHVRGHGADHPMLCDICGFTTKHYASMNLHKRMHSGDVFKCHYEGCSYSEARKNRYLDHIAGHEGIKNHICSVCGKGFGARKHLLRHENTHNEQKAMKCDLCDYASTRQDKLRQHLKIHHPVVALERGYVTKEWAAKQQINLATIAARPPSNKQHKRSKKSDAGMSKAPAVPHQMNTLGNASENVSCFEAITCDEASFAARSITMTSPVSPCGTEASIAGSNATADVVVDVVREEASLAVRAITMTSPMSQCGNEAGGMGEGQLVASPSSHSVHSMQDQVELQTQNAQPTQNPQSGQSAPNTQSTHSTPTGSTQHVPLPVGLHQMTVPLSEEMLHYVYAAQHHAWDQYQQVYTQQQQQQQDINQPK